MLASYEFTWFGIVRRVFLICPCEGTLGELVIVLITGGCAGAVRPRLLLHHMPALVGRCRLERRMRQPYAFFLERKNSALVKTDFLWRREVHSQCLKSLGRAGQLRHLQPRDP